MLDTSVVDEISLYLKQQAQKLSPILASIAPEKAYLSNQLVESYISDLILYLFERLGPLRTSTFKQKHFQIEPKRGDTPVDLQKMMQSIS